MSIANSTSPDPGGRTKSNRREPPRLIVTMAGQLDSDMPQLWARENSVHQ